MKPLGTLCIMGLILVSCLTVFAQGKVTLANNSLRCVYFRDSNQLITAAHGFKVDLWVGTAADTLTYAGSSAGWNSSYPGIFNNANLILPSGFPGGSTTGGTSTDPYNYFFQVQVYPTNYANATATAIARAPYGVSDVFRSRASSSITYNSILSTGNPSFSTFLPGVVALSGGYYGAIPVGVAALTKVSPEGQKVWIGDAFTITCQLLLPDVLVQWSLNGTPIPSATNMVYTVTNAQLSAAEEYSVVATPSYGDAETNGAVVQVLPFGALSVRINGKLAVGTMKEVGPTQLSIVSGFTNGLVFFTLDGTAPTTGSAFYTAPVTLTNTSIVRALGLTRPREMVERG